MDLTIKSIINNEYSSLPKSLDQDFFVKQLKQEVFSQMIMVE